MSIVSNFKPFTSVSRQFVVPQGQLPTSGGLPLSEECFQVPVTGSQSDHEAQIRSAESEFIRERGTTDVYHRGNYEFVETPQGGLYLCVIATVSNHQSPQ